MTYGSVYEITNPLTTIAGQRFAFDFSGAETGSISSGGQTGVLGFWTITNNVGSSTYGCVDEVDGGFKITTGGDNNNALTLNNSNNATNMWTNPTGCKWIAVAKFHQTTNQIGSVGLRALTSTSNNNNGNLWFTHSSWSGNFHYLVALGNTEQYLDVGVAVDTDWHTFQGEQDSTSCKGTLDGILRSTLTGSNRPNTSQMASMQMRNLNASSHSMSIRYFEVYNT